MDKKHLEVKPKRILALEGSALRYITSADSERLPPGLYKPAMLRTSAGFVPGFLPVEMSNDKPLEVDDTVKEIVREVSELFKRREIFKKVGFAHKRGYLLHGPPGCGKSSLMRLLEERFVAEFKGVVLFWDEDTNIELFYNIIREEEGDRPIMVVCEDIDAFIEDFETLLLEFLDGQRGLDNFVLVATTNNLKDIPSRIKDRPSRIDRVVEIKLPNTEARYQYLRQVGVESSEARVIAERTNGMSMAHVKEAVVGTVCLGQDLDSVIKRLEAAEIHPTKEG